MKKVNEVSQLAGVSIDYTMMPRWNVCGRFWYIGKWNLI